MHHLCVGVADIHAVLANMKANGMQLIDEQPKNRCRRSIEIAFVHPKSMNGILLEFQEK
ncbi:MAG: hypothetical protein R3C26_11880 [Calditrichia bacterium]